MNQMQSNALKAVKYVLFDIIQSLYYLITAISSTGNVDKETNDNIHCTAGEGFWYSL